jgi:hypothetical protein
MAPWNQCCAIVVGLGGLEPPASPLSGVRSDQLSYRPVCGAKALAINVWSARLLVWGLVGRCFSAFLVKEVIQPQVPLRLPCYDFTPVIGHTVASALLSVRLPASGATNSHGVTGGVYKARERIHRGMLIRDY